jgi:carboxylate-amine ligase
VRVCDRLRPVLPVLLAASSSSPFLDGNDTGLHSARSQIFTKSFPRCGVPDAFGNWRAFRDYLELLIATSSIVEYTQVWWSIRPHATFGTVEVRICDAQVTAAESEALAGLIVACVGQALRDIDEGVAFDDPAHRLIEENVWRAIRHGMDGKMIDLGRGVEIDAAEALEDLYTWTAPVRDEQRIDSVLDGPNGAQRQRAALLQGGDLRDVYADTVRETMTTYAQEVPA